MDFSKIKKISFILLILFILLFPFWCVRGLCAEEVELSSVNGITITSNSNSFVENSSATLKYFLAKKGFKYYINLGAGQTTVRLVSSSADIPAVNVPYDIVATVQPDSTFTYVANSDTYIALATSGYWSVTSEEVPGMNSAISNLVDNVGINSVWNIFDISINYIVVVVLFAFGCYIIFRIIRKISRGKEGL